MSKVEYNKFIKEKQKEAVEQKQHEYYNLVNNIIDYANKNRGSLVINGGQKQFDRLISQLFDKTVNCIKRIKTVDSEEWSLIGEFIACIKNEIEKIVSANQQILEYYKSPDFL